MLNISDFEEKIKREWEKQLEKIQEPNVLILGKSGVGKSSLINTIFGREIAPVAEEDEISKTKRFKEYRGIDYGISVNVVDSIGYMSDEVDTDNRNKNLEVYKNKCKQYIDKTLKDDSEKHIHLVWYCITAEKGTDIQEDLVIIKAVEELLPGKICIIFTKCDKDLEKKNIRRLVDHLQYEDYTTYQASNKVRTNSYDLENIIEWSVQHLDTEEYKKAFIRSQFVSLKEKTKKANMIIAAATTASAAIGGSPIPFSDAPLLIVTQSAMSIGVVYVYGLDIFTGTISTVMGDAILTAIGKAMVTGIMKLIPEPTTKIPILVTSGAIAATITGAVGFGISKMCERYCERILSGEKVDVDDVFNKKNMETYMKTFNKMQKEKQKKEKEKQKETKKSKSKMKQQKEIITHTKRKGVDKTKKKVVSVQ